MKNDWLLITKSNCIYCKAAKKYLKENNQTFLEIEINKENKKKIFKIIDKNTDTYRMYPIIFKNDYFIGGYSELIKSL